jgi:hypothetical protein
VTFLVTLFDSALGDLVHTLSERHGEETFTRLDLLFLADFFDFLHGVGTGRKDEEDRGVGVRIFNSFFKHISEGVLGVHIHVGVTER